MTLRLPTLCVGLLGICLILGGCGKQRSTRGLTPVTLQTDWYPQPEHGGFYDAQIRGYYKDEGLEVTILPGGPYVNSAQQVSAGTVQFAMGSSDNTLESVGNGVPLVAVAATMQHDPQAIMVHQDSPVHSFQDLDGHAVAIRLGSSTWFEYLVKRYQLKNVARSRQPTAWPISSRIPGTFNRSSLPLNRSSPARPERRCAPCSSARRDTILTVSS